VWVNRGIIVSESSVAGSIGFSFGTYQSWRALPEWEFYSMPIGLGPDYLSTLWTFNAGRGTNGMFYIVFPHWVSVALALILPALWFRRGRRRYSLSCPSCGYDLRASTGDCPECGTPIQKDECSTER